MFGGLMTATCGRTGLRPMTYAAGGLSCLTAPGIGVLAVRRLGMRRDRPAGEPVPALSLTENAAEGGEVLSLAIQ